MKGKCIGKQTSVKHYAAGGMVRDRYEKPYANTWFDRPHEPDEVPDVDLIPQERNRTAPIEMRPRARRKSQTI